MKPHHGHEVEGYFNQLGVNVEQDYAGVLQRLASEVYGLRRAKGATADDAEASNYGEGVTVESKGENDVAVTFSSEDSASQQKFHFAKNVLRDCSNEQEPRDLGPALEDVNTALRVMHAVRLARFEGDEW